MHIITAGQPFMDIDAYAGCVALAELLRLQGEDALAVSSTHWNASVPPLVQSWNTEFVRGYQPAADDTFTLVDISEPQYFDRVVNPANIVGIIDHHSGHEALWHQLGDKAIIEPVGAACTLIYEQWLASDNLDKISKTNAGLLVCGILDNTLNLKGLVTTDRDHVAYDDLLARSGLGSDWPATYFAACQQHIASDPASALQDDSKLIQYPGRTDTLYVGQLALWNAGDFLRTQQTLLKQVLSKPGHVWYLNLIDIAQQRSVFWCEDAELQTWLARLLNLTFQNNIATADRMWLRKEIMRQAITQSESMPEGVSETKSKKGATQ